ncbi:MAG: hypothetical protein LBE80_06000 [Deltaproteobacteria bacterium]|jgi:TctA family transporter|nr:hypothetical protein [Deltaproteobacteria bacterium]
MAKINKKTSPGLYFVIYIIGIVVLIAIDIIQGSKCSAGFFVIDLHNMLFCFYIYLLLGIVRFKYDFIPIGQGFLFLIIFISFFASLSSFNTILLNFADEECSSISLQLSRENIDRVNNLAIAMFVEFIIFAIFLLILTKKPKPIP